MAFWQRDCSGGISLWTERECRRFLVAMKIFWSPWAHVMAVTGSCEGGGGERRRERERKGREREEEGERIQTTRITYPHLIYKNSTSHAISKQYMYTDTVKLPSIKRTF